MGETSHENFTLTQWDTLKSNKCQPSESMALLIDPPSHFLSVQIIKKY